MLTTMASLFLPQIKLVNVGLVFIVTLFLSFKYSLVLSISLLPFFSLFHVSLGGGNYDIIFVYFCITVFIQGCRYLYALFTKERKLNLPLLIVALLFIAISFIGFDKGAILRILRTIATLGLLYFVVEYHDEIDFKKICIYLGITLGVSLAFGLIITQIPQYHDTVWYRVDNRYVGFAKNANYITMICMLELILAMLVYINGQIGFGTFAILEGVTFVNGVLTKGKAFVLMFLLTLIFYFIWLFIKNKKRALIEFFVCSAFLVIIFLIFRNKFIEIFSRFFNDWNGDLLIDKILTGRYSIWRVYINDWTTSWKYILFGRGLGYVPVDQLIASGLWSAGPHSDYVYILYYFGIFGVLAFCSIITLCFYAFRNQQKIKRTSYSVMILFLLMSFTNNIICTEFVFLYLITFASAFHKPQVVERKVFDYNSVEITKTQKTKMKISVLMSVYKNDIADNVELAVKTLLNQTYKPSQIVIVRDGIVGDDLQVVLDKYKQNKLFTIIERDENLGLGKTLAEGTEYCKYDYIARMDADDVCVPTRFEKQIKCFIANPSLDIVGSNGVEFVNTLDNLSAVKKVPETDEEIKQMIKSRCPMCHMSVMMKKQALIDAGGYQDWYYAEDWYLWVRMCLKGVKFYNIQENLMLIRINEDTYGRRHGMKYFKSIKGILKFIHKNKLSSFVEYFKACCVRFVGHVLVPQKLKTKLFKKYLRDGEIDNDTKDYSLHLAR